MHKKEKGEKKNPQHLTDWIFAPDRMQLAGVISL